MRGDKLSLVYVRACLHLRVQSLGQFVNRLNHVPPIVSA